MINKVPHEPNDLQNELVEQLRLLRKSCDEFDNGDLAESRRIASSLRTLLHETKRSHSLLGQLDKLNGQFVSTAIGNEVGNLAGYCGLTCSIMSPSSSKVSPFLDEGPPPKLLDFNQWWNSEVIILDQKKSGFSRRDIVLTMADQDGGSHVDPQIDAAYYELSRKNSMGIMFGLGNQWEDAAGVVQCVVRQVAHELFKSLDKNYSKKFPPLEPNTYIVGSYMVVEGPPSPQLPLSLPQKPGRRSARRHRH